MKRAVVLLALLATIAPAGAVFGDPAAEGPASGGPTHTQPAAAGSELERYVSVPDPSYSWREVASGRSGDSEFIEAILTSQTWHGITWKHQLFIIKPARVNESARAALLYIDGGSWQAVLENGIGRELPRRASAFVRAAERMHAPVIVVRQVPFQPLFGHTEDALIAYTFDRFFETGNPDWPLLVPMVKSAVRAMDAGREIAHRQWGLAIDRYLVTGASKRGWTSWLTAAVDPRVMSVAPMAIDMLGIPAQITLQRETFGGQLSPEIEDFEAIGLPARIDTPAGRALVSIVDPYSYRDRLTMPKLTLVGTNDPYWPVDAPRVYWSGLPPQKRILYLPNQAHDLKDVDRLIGSVAALYRYSTRGQALPDVSGAFIRQAGELDLTVRADRGPERVLAWSATSETRDFHRSHWVSRPCSRSDHGYLCRLPIDRDGFTALYGEAEFKDRGQPPFSLSTLVCVAGAADGSAARTGNAAGTRGASTADADDGCGVP